MARFEGKCWKCGTHWEGDSQPGRRDCCERCDQDLHCCRNCRHYDTRYHNDCRVSEASFVKDRERANFCEYFEISDQVSNETNKLDQARKRLDSLFGG